MKFYDLNKENITGKIVLEVIMKTLEKRNFVITHLSILGATGFPIAVQSEILNNKNKTQKIKKILEELETKGILKKRESKQDFKGIKETAYNYIG